MSKKVKIFNIVSIVCIATAGAFFYFHSKKIVTETQNNQTNLSTNQDNACTQESKDHCLERISKFDDEQLLNEVLARSNKGNSYYLVLEYFNCKLLGEKNEEAYANVKNFINNSALPNEMAKIYYYDWFGKVYSGEYDSEFVGFLENLALGDINKICPNELVDMCQTAGKVFEVALDLKEIDAICSPLCSNLKEYVNINQDELDAKIGEDFRYYENNSQNGYLAKPILAYRFGGKEKARKICDKIQSDLGKNACNEVMTSITGQENGCDTVPDNIKDLICADSSQ